MNINTIYRGARCATIPQPFIDIMRDNPVTGDLFVTSLGCISSVQLNNKTHTSVDDEYLLLYCTAGKGYVETSNDGFTITEDKCIVLSCINSYNIKPNTDSSSVIYWIVFQGVKAKIYAASMVNMINTSCGTDTMRESRIAMFETIFSSFTMNLSIDRLNYCNITFLYLLASFVHLAFMTDSERDSNVAKNDVVQRVTKYMSENIEKNITLDELARHSGYSRSYFYRKFVTEIGESPITYFNKMKINKAAVYLIKSNMSILQISIKLGFNNADYFSRIFKKIFGISASDFRKEQFKL